MLSVLRGSRLAVVAAVAGLAFLAAVVCPCVSTPAPRASVGTHECCTQEDGIAAATTSCCAPDAGRPRVSTPLPASVSLAALPAASAFESAGLPHPAFAVPASPVPGRAPLILRI